MNPNRKKILLIALSCLLFIGIFLVEKNNINKKVILSNQNLDKNIALTFDDGPYGTSTEKILDILKQENIHATFFVIGKNVEKFPDLARRIVAEGNLIENHSYDHSKVIPDMSTTTFEKNIQQAESVIFLVTSKRSAIFRPPYGNISAHMYAELNHDRYTTVLWNVDAADWDYKNSPTKLIEKIIIKDAKTNGIIILHDGRDTKINYPRDNTIDALPYVIEQLKREGYNFVTVDKIIGVKPYFDEK